MLGEIRLRPKCLVGVEQRDASTHILGHKISFPAMVAPMAQQMAHPLGEKATAEAAGNADTIFCLSTISTYQWRRS